VRLTPQPPGRWLWIDTRTLRFQPDGRLPMATRYVVEVPAGTRSAAGATLAAAVRADLATPARAQSVPTLPCIRNPAPSGTRVGRPGPACRTITRAPSVSSP
jgi:hypothetical protein